MPRQEEIEKIIQELVKMETIIPVVDKKRIAKALVDAGIGSSERFEIGTDMIGVMAFIKPKQY